MAMKVPSDIRDREWDLYSRQLDAWRTQQLIEADRQRQAEYAKKLARDVAEMEAVLSETKAALSEKNAALSEAEARAHAAEATLAKLLRDLGRD